MPIRTAPVQIKLDLNHSYSASFEVDTGSYVSTIRHDDARLAGAEILPTQERALAYGGAKIELLGECNINVSFASKIKMHRFLVVHSNQENLLGRDLCSAFNIKMCLPCDSNQVNNANLLLSGSKSQITVAPGGRYQAHLTKGCQGGTSRVDENALPIHTIF